MTDETQATRCQHCYADIAPTDVANRWVAVTNGNRAASPSCDYPVSLFHKPMPRIEIAR